MMTDRARHHRARRPGRVLAATLSLAAIVALVVVAAACHDGVSRRLAQEAALAGNHEEALHLALEAVRAKPGDPVARQLLEQAARTWAGERRDRLAAAQGSGGSEAAAVDAQTALRLLRTLEREYRLGLAATVHDLEQIGTRLAEGQAQRFFEQGEAAFGRRDWHAARDAFVQALYFRPEFPEARARLVQTYFNIGEQAFAQRLYRAASENFQQVLAYDSRQANARNRLVESHLALADWYRDNHHPRLELADLERARALDPSLPRIAERIADARERATIRLAVLPLNPDTGIPVQLGSFNVPELLRDKLATKINNRKSEFVRLIDRQHVKKLIDEIYFSRSDFVRDGMRLPIDAFEVCDTLIAGRLTQLDARGPLVTRFPEQGTVTVPLWRDERRVDQEGRVFYVPVVYGNAQVPYDYIRVEKSVSVALSGSALALDVATSRAKNEKSFSLADSDATTYAEGFRMGYIPPDARTTQDMVFRMQVPGRVKELLNARREVRSPESMAEGMIETITTEWAVEILRAIDTAAEIPEPFARSRP